MWSSLSSGKNSLYLQTERFSKFSYDFFIGNHGHDVPARPVELQCENCHCKGMTGEKCPFQKCRQLWVNTVNFYGQYNIIYYCVHY